jgi:hypothetical protein
MSRLREFLDSVLECRLTKPQEPASVAPYPPDKAVSIRPIIEELQAALMSGCLQRQRLERAYREAGLHDEWRQLYAKVDPGLYAIYRQLAPIGLGLDFLADVETRIYAEAESQTNPKGEQEHK